MRDDTPVLVGAGQFAYQGEAAISPISLHLLKVAAEQAVLDAGRKGSVLADLDAVARFAARAPADPEMLYDPEGREDVGRTGVADPLPDGDRNLFILD